MKILLMGGTGAMGSHLVKILKGKKHDIHVTTRNNRENEIGVRYITGNARNKQFLSEVLSSNHYDAIVDFMVYSTREFAERAELLLSGCDHYFYLSSARVYDNGYGSPISEDSVRLLDVSKDEEYLQTDEYALKKARQENILTGSCRNNWTIIRPYITFDENRLQFGAFEKEQWACRPQMGLPIVFSKDMANYHTTMTYGGDVAKAIALLMGRQEAKGEIVNVMTEENFTWNEIKDIYVNVFRNVLNIDPEIVMTEKSSKLRFKSMQYQVKYCRCTERIFDNSKLLKLCPEMTFSPVKDKLVQCLTRIIKDKSRKNISSFDYALLDKDCGKFTPLLHFRGKEKLKYCIFRFLPIYLIDYYINRKM